MTEETGKSNVVPATESVYARLPAYLVAQVEEFAETHAMTRSAALRHLVEVTLAGGWPERGETAREARYRMALEIIKDQGPCSLCDRAEYASIALGGRDG